MTLIVLWRIGFACMGTVIGPNKRAHDAIKADTLCILGRVVGRVLRRIPSNTVGLRSGAVGIGI